MTRDELATSTEQVGKELNTLRENLKDTAPFVAGIIRAAEESVLVAYVMLTTADEKEL